MATAPLLDLATWVPIIDGDEWARDFYESHYSSERSLARRRERGTKLILGPGYKLLLATPCRRALFAWRKQKHRSGVECAIFSNRGAGLSSSLIREADEIADQRWPGERHFTYVDPRRIESPNPGYCFKVAGWRFVGITSERGLHILERPAP